MNDSILAGDFSKCVVQGYDIDLRVGEGMGELFSSLERLVHDRGPVEHDLRWVAGGGRPLAGTALQGRLAEGHVFAGVCVEDLDFVEVEVGGDGKLKANESGLLAVEGERQRFAFTVAEEGLAVVLVDLGEPLEDLRRKG